MVALLLEYVCIALLSIKHKLIEELKVENTIKKIASLKARKKTHKFSDILIKA